MGLAAGSAVSSDEYEFAAFLDVELDATSDASAGLEEAKHEIDNHINRDKGDSDLNLKSVKRRKVQITNPQSFLSQGDTTEALESSPSPEKNTCRHPGNYAGMCVKCGQKVDDKAGVAFGYIHKNLRLANEEVARLRAKDWKSLLHRRKLHLVLDLDHTLLNSSHLSEIIVEEGYLRDRDALPENLQGSLFQVEVEQTQMMTKLRPFVHAFLKEASKLFDMYIYTMGTHSYAKEMAKLLDPEGRYFNSRIIGQENSTKNNCKGLDVVLGQESAVLILDDNGTVWRKHKENLILMERYHFFASSCKQFGHKFKSFSERKSDESETKGALGTGLKVLQRVHELFFDQELEGKLEDRDVRQILKRVRKEVLVGCKLLFSRILPAEQYRLWKMARQLGAECSKEVDESVTHVVSIDAGTEKYWWAVKEKKFLVNPNWIEASKYRWQRQLEDKYPIPVTQK